MRALATVWLLVAQWQRAQTRARVLALSTVLAQAEQIEGRSFAEDPATDGLALAEEEASAASRAVEVASEARVVEAHAAAVAGDTGRIVPKGGIAEPKSGGKPAFLTRAD
jgi:hypothetical protein